MPNTTPTPDAPTPTLATRAADLLAALADDADPAYLLFSAREFRETVRALTAKAAAFDLLCAAGSAERGERGGWFVRGDVTWPDAGPWYGATLQEATENARLAVAPGVGHRPHGTVRDA